MSAVYFVQAGDTVKIGYSADVSKRMSQLQTGSGFPLRLLLMIEHDNPRELEQKLHEEFCAHRLEGEWFRLDQKIKDFIEAWTLISSDVETKTSPAASRFVDRIRASGVRTALHGLEWWVVEWSESRGICVARLLIEHLSNAHNTFLYARSEAVDWTIVAVVEDIDIASNLAIEMEPWLIALRAARRLGCIEGVEQSYGYLRHTESE